jgi:hypothetical protein
LTALFDTPYLRKNFNASGDGWLQKRKLSRRTAFAMPAISTFSGDGSLQAKISNSRGKLKNCFLIIFSFP